MDPWVATAPRMRLAIVSTVTALVLLAGFVAWISRDTPDGVVRDYLRALQLGKVAEALAHATDVPDSPFLTSEALSPSLVVTGVDEPETTDDFSSVAYHLRGTPGGRFTLVRDGWSWQIRNPVDRVSFLPTAYPFVQIGDVRVPVRRNEYTIFWFFPGTYAPFTGIKNTALAPESPWLTVAPDFLDNVPKVYQATFLATKTGDTIAQDAADALLSGYTIVRRPVMSVRAELTVEVYAKVPGVLRRDGKTCTVDELPLVGRLDDAGVLTVRRGPGELKCTTATG